MSKRLQALAIAITQLGVKEVPAGTNSGPQVDKYLAAAGLGPGYAWCAAFLTWCYDQVGLKVTFPGPALVQNWDNWAATHGEVVTRPFKGDVVTFDWNGDNWYDHVGQVEKVLAIRGKVYWFKSIEGNSDNQVKRNWHWTNRQGTKFARIKDASPI